MLISHYNHKNTLMKKNYLILSILLCLFFFAFNFNSYSQNPEWIVFDTSNSELPDNIVYTVDIDNEGNKWFGTSNPEGRNNNLVIFDGTEWRIYSISSYFGLPAHIYVSNIAFDNDGNAWIGTAGGTGAGIIKLSGEEWVIYDGTNSGLPSTWIDAIAIDEMGNIWIGSSGVTRFDGVEWYTFNTSNSGLLYDDVRDILIDTLGNKWVATLGGGLSKFDDSTWITYIDTNSNLPSNEVCCIILDNFYKLWIGAWYTDSLVKFDGEIWYAYQLPPFVVTTRNIFNLAADVANNIWTIYGNVTSGISDLVEFDGTEWAVYTSENSGLQGNWEYDIAVDEYNNKWIATDSGVVVDRKGGVVNTIHNPQFIKSYKFISLKNYPNPFRFNTTIKFTLPKASHVKLSVYDMSGCEVAVLVDKFKQTGEHQVLFNAKNLSNGVYFYRLRSGDLVRTGKMVVAR